MINKRFSKFKWKIKLFIFISLLQFKFWKTFISDFHWKLSIHHCTSFPFGLHWKSFIQYWESFCFWCLMKIYLLKYRALFLDLIKHLLFQFEKDFISCISLKISHSPLGKLLFMILKRKYSIHQCKSFCFWFSSKYSIYNWNSFYFSFSLKIFHWELRNLCF